MRAEIMDLEDKYFLMKSQRDDALNALVTQGKSDQAGRIKRRSPAENLPTITSQRVMSDGIEYYPHETHHYDSSILDAPDIDRLDRPTELSPPNNESLEQIPSRSNGGDGRPSVPNRQSARAASNSGSDSSARPAASNHRLTKPSKDVHEVVIDLMHTGPQRDPIQGTPILQVLLQPLTIDNEVVFDTGQLSVRLQDPRDDSPKGQWGQWNFLPDELYLFYRRTSPIGIMLELPLDLVPASGAELEVVCQYQTADGRTLQSRAVVPLERTLKKSPPIDIQQGDDDLRAQFQLDDGLQLPIRRQQSSRISASPVSNPERPQWRPNR